MSKEITKHAPLTIQTVDDLARIADMMAKSGYFTDARDAAQAGVKILAGQGWGIAPFDAMAGIHVIKNRPSIGAGLMATQVKASGKYDYRVKQLDNEAAVIEFFEDGESIGVSSFTIADARAAGTQNLQKFARNMLFARAMSNGVRWYCPDVFASPVYVPEELGAPVDGDGNIITVPARDVSAPEAFPEPSADEDTAELSPALLKALHARLNEVGIGRARDAKLAFLSYELERDITSTNGLTRQEAVAILNHDDLEAAIKEWAETLQEPAAEPEAAPEPATKEELAALKKRLEMLGFHPMKTPDIKLAREFVASVTGEDAPVAELSGASAVAFVMMSLDRAQESLAKFVAEKEQEA